MITKLFPQNPAIYILSSAPRRGKTTLIKYIIHTLFQQKQLNYGLLFCPTIFNGSYDWLPKKYSNINYSEDKVKSLMKIQLNQIKTKGSCEKSYIIFDDCLGSINFNSAIFKKLFSSYRHYNISLFFGIQYIYHVPPILRETCTYFICFNQTTKKSIKAIYECFMQDFNTEDECKKYIDENTKDYHFIVVNTEIGEGKYKISKCPLLTDIFVAF